MSIYKFVITMNRVDPRSAGYLADARALGYRRLKRVDCQDLIFIESQLSQEQLQRLALGLLSDPVTQNITREELPSVTVEPEAGTVVLEVALRPGVTDPVAHEIVRAAHQLGLTGVRRAATGTRFLITGLPVEEVEGLTRSLLANPVIQHWKIGSIEPSFPEEAASSGAVEILPVRYQTDDELLTLSKSRRAALDLAELQAVQGYFLKEGRDPTDVEFETVAQTWSEHCVHKTFKARIEVSDAGSDDNPGQPSITILDSLIKTYLKSATDRINVPWVISAFVDNAGIIEFDDDFEISFKVETHNHPSAVEPFGGANTGVGGVIRDVIGVSAKPIANTDVLCFGPQNLDPASLPEGVLHPRRIQSGVVAGVQDYGNKIGIPTVNGAVLYDEGYTANPLVFCGCVGIAPRGKHRKQPQAGDRVIVLGGRTGRDGLRGATFSSMTMDAQTGEVSGASVQIGDPITEKGLIDVIVRARDLGLYNDITDCGAGGLSSAVGEMASVRGCDVNLAGVRLKYPGLAPWEIWLSEAQERMVLAVSLANLAALQDLCDTFDTELTDIGAITGNGKLIVRYAGEVIIDLDNEFLHGGLPQRQLQAIITKTRYPDSASRSAELDMKDRLLSLLSSPNIASKAAIIRLYDYEVQGGTVIKPLTGVQADAPSDAAVIKPIGTAGAKGIVLSNGINPEYGKRDAYRMAWSVMDEAVRNAVAVGADPDRIAVLDNFCWGDPLRPETLGTLVEACRGCHDAAVFYGTPFISGKDSLNNEYLGSDGLRHSIPPTLLISAIGVIPDIHRAVSMDLKSADNTIYLLGEIPTEQTPVPDVPPTALQVYRALYQSIAAGVVKSAHDLNEGGLGVAAAEMCIGGRLGMELDVDPSILFSEVNGCLLVEVSPHDALLFAQYFTSLPILKIGRVTANPVLKLSNTEINVAELVHAFNHRGQS
ncbi:MAG: phosphoribosylformylglycinamidine synthase subunit PurS [Anaerolineaceae bacterium]